MTTFVRKLLVALFFISTVAVFSTRSSAQDSSDGGRKVVLKTAAVYPSLAQSMNIHGVVKLEAHVAPNGTVKSVDIKGGHPILTQAAVTAVGHWKFEPASHETKELIEVKFEAQ